MFFWRSPLQLSDVLTTNLCSLWHVYIDQIRIGNRQKPSRNNEEANGPLGFSSNFPLSSRSCFPSLGIAQKATPEIEKKNGRSMALSLLALQLPGRSSSLFKRDRCCQSCLIVHRIRSEREYSRCSSCKFVNLRHQLKLTSLKLPFHVCSCLSSSRWANQCIYTH